MLWQDDLTDEERQGWLRGLASREHACGNKQKYSKESAVQAARKMENKLRKTGKKFDPYFCLWCEEWHIGKSVRQEDQSELEAEPVPS